MNCSMVLGSGQQTEIRGQDQVLGLRDWAGLLAGI